MIMHAASGPAYIPATGGEFRTDAGGPPAAAGAIRAALADGGRSREVPEHAAGPVEQRAGHANG